RNIASFNKKVEKEGDSARRAHKPAKEKRVVDLTDPQLSIPQLQQAAAAGEVARQESDNPAVQLMRENERRIAVGEAPDVPEGVAPDAHVATHEPLRKLPYLVIINAPGAENLLGMGDMLILPPGTSTLTRVHGPFVDEKEIHAVVEHWKAQGAPVYDPNILKPRAEDGDGVPEDDQGPDELYDQAIAAVSDMRFIS